jgi:asparagine synthase (glutamine-hydrolysing)
MGFGVPVGEWFRGPLRELLCDVLLAPRSLARGYFRPSELKRHVTQHLERRADLSFQLWNLLMLELWHQEFVDSPRLSVVGER